MALFSTFFLSNIIRLYLTFSLSISNLGDAHTDLFIIPAINILSPICVVVIGFFLVGSSHKIRPPKLAKQRAHLFTKYPHCLNPPLSLSVRSHQINHQFLQKKVQTSASNCLQNVLTGQWTLHLSVYILYGSLLVNNFNINIHERKSFKKYS